jgi:hypothetical protein
MTINWMHFESRVIVLFQKTIIQNSSAMTSVTSALDLIKAE